MRNLPTGWEHLSKSEDRAVSRHFRHGLSFFNHRNKAGQRTIVEPANSVTYSLTEMGHYLSDAYKKRAWEMCQDYVQFFRRVIPADDFVIAYDPYHERLKFWPHRDFEYDEMDDWPVPPFPDGDYTAFFSSNLKSCLYGFMWEPKSVCVIGGRFIHAIREARPRAFERVIRVGGK